MDDRAKPHNLEQLLARISKSSEEGDPVPMRAALEEIGRRSFGPVLLFAGLITLAPVVGDIPGVPTIMAFFVLLVAGQLLLRQEHFWLPNWLLERSVSRHKLCKSLDWMRRPARFIDKLIRPRLTSLTRGAGVYAIAVCCLLIAVCMPVMEVVPFSANGAGLALTAFGLALMAHDGLLALIAFIATVATLGIVGYNLFF